MDFAPNPLGHSAQDTHASTNTAQVPILIPLSHMCECRRFHHFSN